MGFVIGGRSPSPAMERKETEQSLHLHRRLSAKIQGVIAAYRNTRAVGFGKPLCTFALARSGSLLRFGKIYRRTKSLSATERFGARAVKSSQRCCTKNSCRFSKIPGRLLTGRDYQRITNPSRKPKPGGRYRYGD